MADEKDLIPLPEPLTYKDGAQVACGFGTVYEAIEKIGISRKALGKAVRNEICFAYYCPFLLMTVTSYFSVKALGNIMREDLLWVNLWSALFVLVLFTFICSLSVRRAKRRIFALRKER